MSRGRGLIRNLAHRWLPYWLLAKIEGFEPHQAAADSPGRTLESFAPAVMDQGSGDFATSSCEGHSTSCGVYTVMESLGQPLPFVPSPKDLYDNGRALARKNPDDPLTDEGIDTPSVLAGLIAFGVGPIKAPTSDGRYSDCEPATINDGPKLGELEVEAQHLEVTGYQITSTGQTLVHDIAQAIDNGRPVRLDVFVDSAFEAAGPGTVLGAPNMSDESGGWHAVVLLAFRVVAGAYQFLLRNSWGPGWCDAGNAWVNEAFIAAIGGAYVLEPKLAEAA